MQTTPKTAHPAQPASAEPTTRPTAVPAPIASAEAADEAADDRALPHREPRLPASSSS